MDAELFDAPFNLAGELLDNSMTAEGVARVRALAEHEARKAQQTFQIFASEIERAYVRHYSDNGQVTAYIEWANGSRTEGEPENGQMLALMTRAQREGLNITRENW